MKDNMAGFRAKWPDGISVLAYILPRILQAADAQDCPLERWDQGHFDELRHSVRNTFTDLRLDSANTQRMQWKVQQVGATVAPAQIKIDAKATRQYLKRIEPEALGFVTVLAKRVLNERTRDKTCMFIREWRKACSDPNISPHHLSRSLLDYLRQDYIETPSDGLTRQLLEKIERAEFDTEGRNWPTAQGIALRRNEAEHWTYELMPAEEGRQREGLFLPAPDIDQKLQAAMADYAESLGDRDSDLMILAMARFAERAKHPDDKVTITIDELMAAINYGKRRGGGGGESYGAAEKTAVRERFEKLENGYLTIRKAGKDGRTNRAVDVESRVLVIEDRIGQADLDGRVRDWQKVTVRFGRAWSYRLGEPGGKMTALLQAQALAYDAQKERIEKRLLKRLGWHWKLNAKRDPVTQRTAMIWLRDDVGDDPLSYRRRDAERLEHAFDRLKRDGQIAAWRYADGQHRIDETEGELPRGWLDKWLEREITVEAPQALQLAYEERRNKPKAQPVIEVRPADDLGGRFRAFREARNISALAAAKDLDIAGSTLSRIETGKRPPTDEQRAAMEGWMRDMKNRPGKLRDAVGH